MTRGLARPLRACALGAALLALSLFLAAAASADHSQLDLVSTGPQQGSSPPYSVNFNAVSSDGSRVIFGTNEPLTSDDTDSTWDIYMRQGGVTTLLTGGAGTTPGGASFVGASADLSHVFFVTNDAATADDTDLGWVDLYEWRSSDNSIRLVSDRVQDSSDGSFNASFAGASQDGSRVFFATPEPITSDDVDANRGDIYERYNGTTTRVTVSNKSPDNGGDGIFSVGLTPDGTHAYFSTLNSFATADTDTASDLYERTGSTTTLISTGMATNNSTKFTLFAAASPDGSRVAFETNEPLDSVHDTDTASDVYVRSGNTLTLETPGSGVGDSSFMQANPALTQFVYQTAGRHSGDDTDSQNDVYRRTIGGSTALVSGDATHGTGAFDAGYDGATPDLSHVYFESEEQLVSGDTDSGGDDIYERSGSTTRLVSTGPADPQTGTAFVSFDGVSDDGSRVFFDTDAPLVTADTDSNVDLYERHAGTTTLLSTGPADTNGAFDSEFGGATPDGRSVFFSTEESLLASDTDGGADLYVRRVPAPAPGGGGGGTPTGTTTTSGGSGVFLVDRRAPVLKASAARSQRVLKQRGVRVVVQSDESGSFAAGGTINVPRAAKVLKLKGAKGAVAAGARKTVTLKLSKKALRAVASALAHHKRLSAKVTIVVRDAAGNRTARRITIKLKR